MPPLWNALDDSSKVHPRWKNEEQTGRLTLSRRAQRAGLILRGVVVKNVKEIVFLFLFFYYELRVYLCAGRVETQRNFWGNSTVLKEKGEGHCIMFSVCFNFIFHAFVTIS